jgi:hypothetical protein
MTQLNRGWSYDFALSLALSLPYLLKKRAKVIKNVTPSKNYTVVTSDQYSIYKQPRLPFQMVSKGKIKSKWQVYKKKQAALFAGKKILAGSIYMFKILFLWSFIILTLHYILRFLKRSFFSLNREKKNTGHTRVLKPTMLTLILRCGVHSFCSFPFLVVEWVFTGRDFR